MKRRMVQCATQVNRDAVRRESIKGVEHVVVSSFTLPDNVVMNGGLYPAEEIEKSFFSLERTLAPVEHPTNSDGMYISASDPEAIHNFHAGAFNVNVTRENGRIHIEKNINVQEAMKTDRGKRLMDRIEELETNDNARPIHTSVGVFLEVEELSKPQTNSAGDEFTWIARNMFFDHDAILLDSVAAATPDKGVGMAVNASGDQIDVERVIVANEKRKDEFSDKAKANLLELLKIGGIEVNVSGPSFGSIMEQLNHEIHGLVTADWIFVADVFPEDVIFETNQGFFSVPWMVSNGIANISGIPIRVDRFVSYQPKVNSAGGKDDMKELILNALAEAGIETEGLADDVLFAKYNELLAANNEQEGGGNVDSEVLAKTVTEAIKPLTDQVAELTTKVNAASDAERDELIKVIVGNEKYDGLTEADAKALPLDTLKNMAASCGTAHGIAPDFTGNNDDTTYQAPEKMPGDE